MTGKVNGIVAAGLALLILSSGAWLASQWEVERLYPDSPNIILFSIDTLRADHLGCYGYERNTSPVIDHLAAKSTLFTSAWAPSPWTLPSHAGMLTGVHPFAAGIRDRDGTIPDEVPVVAELLKPAGYLTAAFVDETPRSWIGAERGFGRGFDTYEHLASSPTGEFHYDTAYTAERVIQWMRRRDRQLPFFAFVHTKSVHTLPPDSAATDDRMFPYDKPEPYRSMFLTPEEAALSWDDPVYGKGVAYLRSLNDLIARGEFRGDQLPTQRLNALKGQYDSGVFYADAHFNLILEELRLQDIGDETLIIVTSDHGEAFLDRRLLLHKEVDRELVRVPLIVYSSETVPTVVEEDVTLLDIVPTILEAAGVDVPELITGKSLLGKSNELRGLSFFSYYRDSEHPQFEGYSFRNSEWTLIHQRLGVDGEYATELYDRRKDPLERTPVENRLEVVESMMKILTNNLQTPPPFSGDGIVLDQRAIEHLRSLGYIN
jgi:arylsulfatase A-like enzyme